MLDLRRKKLVQLLAYKSYVDLRAEQTRLRLGMLWWIIDPLLYMLVFYFVFSVLLHRGTENYIWFLLIGQISWKWFQTTITHGAYCIEQNYHLMQQVYIPKSFFCSVVIITQSARFFSTFFLLLVLLWGFGFSPNKAYVHLPTVIMVNFLLISGVSYVLASLMPFLPDLRMLLDSSMRALMFMSGIFFSGYELPQHIQFYFFMNPIASIIQSYRDILIDGQAPQFGYLLLVSVFSLLCISLGKFILIKFDKIYPKIVQI